jgi:hypothetical protein
MKWVAQVAGKGDMRSTYMTLIQTPALRPLGDYYKINHG